MRNLLGVPNMLTAYLLLAKVSSLILRAAAGASASDCGAENTLKTGDVIQCRECSYHILYKKWTCRSTGVITELRIHEYMCNDMWAQASIGKSVAASHSPYI
ncbi:unnamed protein product [Urochloa humidicola]